MLVIQLLHGIRQSEFKVFVGRCGDLVNGSTDDYHWFWYETALQLTSEVCGYRMTLDTPVTLTG